MKKLFSLLVIGMLCIAPLGTHNALAQFSDIEFPEFENPAFPEFPDWNPSPDPETPPSDEDITLPEDCTISERDMRTVRNFPRKDGPIIAFGDSLTAGVGATPGQDYVSELERLADVNIINEGLSGNTTLDALARLDRDVLSKNPSVVIVWLGGNDILNRYYQQLNEEANDTAIERLIEAIFEFFGKDPDREEVISEAETFANIEEIVERIQATGALVILVGMDGEPLDNDLGNRYLAVADDTRSILIPDVLENILGRPHLTSDLLHPNNRGYEIVAERVYNGFVCVLDADPDEEEPDDDEDEEEPRDNGGRGGLKKVCVDTDNDGYKECTYVRGGDTTPDPDEEEPDDDEDEEEPRDNGGRGGLKKVCVDTDNDGYKECSYTRR